MYENIKSCVSLGGELSDYFVSLRGVRQGENLSPILFALFINDLEESLLNGECNYINFGIDHVDNLLRIIVLMYADDTIIVANNPQNLKCAMKALERYCDEWQIHVNCSKTKIVVFGGGVARGNSSYELLGEEIENVDCYKYLGITFHRNGNLKKAQDEMIKHASKAMYALVSKGRRLQLPADLMIELFYSLVIPIVTYGSEVWGFSVTRDLEKHQLKSLNLVLNVKSSTCNSVVYGETRVYLIHMHVNKCMVGNWSRILTGKDSKLYSIMYQCMLKLR